MVNRPSFPSARFPPRFIPRRRETFATFEAAKARAEAVAGSLLRGDATAAGFTGTERARFAAILDLLGSTGVSAEIAAAQFAEAHRILGGRSVVDAAREFARRHRLDLPAIPVKTAVTTFIADREKAGASSRYLKDLRSRLLHHFAEDLKVDLGQLSHEVVRQWLEQQKGGPRHFNNNLAAVRTLLRFCSARGWLPRDVDFLEGITKRKAIDGAIEIWNPDEISALLRGCAPRAIPLMAISAFAGLRNAEVVRLDWREVHLGEQFIEVPTAKAKTASRRLAPCPPNLVEWLRPHAKAEGSVWPQHIMTSHGDFRRAAAHAGLKWRENALRHSFISYRLVEINDVARVALESGNSPQMIFRHYRELVRPAEAARWFSIVPPT